MFKLNFYFICFIINNFFLILKGYGEIEPNFVVEHYKKLEKKWFIMNSTCGFIDVDYNLSYENPTIFTGWKQLIDYNQLPENVEIEMEYHGGPTFAIKSFKEIKTAEEILPFHSRSLLPIQTISFDIVLTETTMKKSKLVNLTFQILLQLIFKLSFTPLIYIYYLLFVIKFK
jgi:hypothetical protein